MCEGIQDSLGICIQNCRFLDSGFRSLMGIQISRAVSRIPKSRILDSASNIFQADLGFHKQKFPGFRIPQANISRIPESLTRGERKNSDEKHSGCRILK